MDLIKAASLIKPGAQFAAHDNGKRSEWGMIIGIKDDKVHILLGNEYRVESLNDVSDWLQQGLIR